MSEGKCPNCGSTVPPMLNIETGEYFCPVCGYVYGPIAEPLKPRSQEEYRKKIHSERMPKNPDTTPKLVIRKHLAGSRKLLQESSKTGKYETYLLQVQREFNIPGYVIAEVKSEFEKIRKAGGLKGRSHRLVIATLLFHVSKRYPNVNFTREQLEKIAGVGIRQVYRTYRVLVKEGYIEATNTGVVRKPSQYLPSILSRLKLEIQGRIGERDHLFSSMPEHLLVKSADAFASLLQGTRPIGVAGATVYLFTKLLGYRLNQDFVAKVAGVSPLTIRRILKQITRETDLTIEI
ncbi:transcription initiation factor IIB family protein [Infirmifilum lucidum]|uniref:Transcription initiation factor IIB family protein n=1 Tax=Infirmifilum lucidum TaxID=2776706 RepID=A0A7L9FEV2_9CREN|nr:transcription initiation factor IIB family protein [Infirmifilum lucidum]QOJ78259.1 transcription initiation factor IIB family protein [Infirmifilum lucidum]